MSQRFALFLLAVGAATPALAGPNYRYVHRLDADTYFGHISWCQLQNDADDPRVLRSEGPQRATVNLPLAPGDTLQTTAGRRCEAQFDTGTLLRLEEQTALRIQTILAPSLTSGDKLTNLNLRSGRLIAMYRDYDTREVFQILTSNAALKLSRAAVVDVKTSEDGDTEIEVQRGQASVLYGPSADTVQTRKLKSGERVTVTRQYTLVVAAPSPGRPQDAFQAWNREMNDRFTELHEGKSALPKPLERFPRAVIYFAQRYADPYGEWIWSELYGYVWRPYRSQDEGWRPYMLGRWVPMSGRQFWVPDEPWGWVPYHLGLWHFDKKHGWVWLPGSAFAPAWVTWGMCDDVRYFRPLTLWDWGFRYRYRYGHSFWNTGYGYGYGVGQQYGCGFFPYSPNENVVAQQREATAPAAAPTAALPVSDKPMDAPRMSELPLLPLPKELVTLAKKAEVLEQRSAPEVRAQVGLVGAGPTTQKAAAEAPLSDIEAPETSRDARFLDWNRDVRAAREAGGHIVYSSVTNLMRCDGCSRPLVNFEFGRSGIGGSGNMANAGNSNNGGGSSGGGDASMTSVGSSGAANMNSGSSSGGANMTDRKQD